MKAVLSSFLSMLRSCLWSRASMQIEILALRHQSNTTEHLELRFCIASTSQALFLNQSGARLSTQGIANIISEFRKDAGIERHITPHMLRPTVATLLLRNGGDIRVVQEFLGHASIATTQRYTHVSKEHLVQMLRECHPSLLLRSVSQMSVRRTMSRKFAMTKRHQTSALRERMLRAFFVVL